METFQWNACFVTGIDSVDEQHHRLIDLINRFGTQVMHHDELPLAETEAVFAELAEYARFHFADEEALMEAARIDPRYVAQHRAAHASFIDEITHLKEGISASLPNAAEFLLQFLTNWLAYHILGLDQYLARQIAAIRAGATPEDAYRDHARIADPATDALLLALHGLFRQVTERNHQLVELNKTLEARVAERTLALTDANQQLDRLANTDALTGLPNRRYAMRSAASEWEASVRKGTPLACMMVDADGFKIINDAHGHDAGDAVLRALSKQLQHAIRNDDLVCRLGGDEFLVICPNTPLEGAMKLAEALRKAVAALRIPAGNGEWRGSISVGVAARTATMTTLNDLIKSADRGVYVAKRHGRNCVAISDQ